MSDTLKIAIPTDGAGGLDAERSMHFGHADSFTIVEVADGEIAGSSAFMNPPHVPGGCKSIVGLLASEGVGTAIVAGMGPGPLAAMAASNIAPMHDMDSATPRAAVEAFLAGRLMPFSGGDSCKGH